MPGEADAGPGEAAAEPGDSLAEAGRAPAAVKLPSTRRAASPAFVSLVRITVIFHLSLDETERPLTEIAPALRASRSQGVSVAQTDNDFRLSFTGSGPAGHASGRPGYGPARRTTPATTAPTRAGVESRPCPHPGGPRPRPGEARIARRAAADVRQGRLLADRWTWLILAACTQLRLARPLAADRRRPWERSVSPDGLTRHVSAAASGTSAPRPSARPRRRNPPAPGRPPGRRNTRPAPRHGVHTPRTTGSPMARNKKTLNPRLRRTDERSSWVRSSETARVPEPPRRGTERCGHPVLHNLRSGVGETPQRVVTHVSDRFSWSEPTS